MVKTLSLLITLIILTGCNANMEMIGKNELHTKLEASMMNSAESWWYAGTKDDHYVIVIKMPFSKDFYAIKKGEVGLNMDEFEFTKDDDAWVNLKAEDLSFE